jgi:GAF domain-containing protein
MTGTDGSRSGLPPRDELSDEQSDSDTADLQSSLGELAALVAGTLGMTQLLTQVAASAVQAIPGADGVGVTLLMLDRPDNMVQALASSHPFVAEIDEIQYSVLQEGPCITAARERRTVRSGSLGGEKMWPRFGPRVGRLGIHSALSLPLLLADGVVGSINVYAREKNAFGDHAADLGELFATPAAVAVHNAQILAQAQDLTSQLQAALSSRPIIDQAIGILRGRAGGTSEEAFARLRAISQSDHTKLVDVAQHIVDEAVRRARARHTQS